MNFHKEMKPYADKLPYKKSNAKYPPRSPNPNYYPPFPYFPGEFIIFPPEGPFGKKIVSCGSGNTLI